MTLEEFLKLPGAKVHDGGPCPVDRQQSVILLRRGMDETPPYPAACLLGRWDWQGTYAIKTHDIIAYREAP